MSCNSGNQNFFQEAYNHSRNKTIMRQTIEDIQLLSAKGLYKQKSFDEVLRLTALLYGSIPGLGALSIYDLTSGICRTNGIPIDKVFIVGGGPQRAARLLGLQPQYLQVGRYKLRYLTIPDVKSALQRKGVLNKSLQACSDGDTFETFLCVWQKTEKIEYTSSTQIKQKCPNSLRKKKCSLEI